MELRTVTLAIGIIGAAATTAGLAYWLAILYEANKRERREHFVSEVVLLSVASLFFAALASVTFVPNPQRSLFWFVTVLFLFFTGIAFWIHTLAVTLNRK